MNDLWSPLVQSERASLRWRRLRTELAQAPNRERRSSHRSVSVDRAVSWERVDAGPLVSAFGSSLPGSLAGSAPSSAPGVRFRGWRRQLPIRELQAVLRESYARVQRLNTPPAGEPFWRDGKPWATDEEFIEDLCEELREQFKRYLKETSKALV